MKYFNPTHEVLNLVKAYKGSIRAENSAAIRWSVEKGSEKATKSLERISYRRQYLHNKLMGQLKKEKVPFKNREEVTDWATSFED